MENGSLKKNAAAIFLAHLNPLTLSHEKIIKNLLQNYVVYVYPVIFLKDGEEVNTRSFPFSYDLRKQMILKCFSNYENNIFVFDDYCFTSPYIRYFPPFLSSAFKKLKKNILSNICEPEYFTYTGDKAERILLKAFGFNPIKANRQIISSTNVKNLLYQTALSSNSCNPNMPQSFYPLRASDSLSESDFANEVNWNDFVSLPVANIIKKNWGIVKHFAESKDETIRIMGMKFPKDGFI